MLLNVAGYLQPAAVFAIVGPDGYGMIPRRMRL